MAIKITTLITGARQWIQASQLMQEETRARAREAIQETTMAVGAKARTNVPVSDAADRKAKGRPGPGELRDSIRETFGVSGLIGFVLVGYGKLPRRSRAVRPTKFGPLRLKAFQRQQRRQALQAMREIGVYAMVVNYGSPGRGISGSRFLDRAKESERSAHIARMQRALSGAASAAARRAG
jgi:hypothetical protein